jgi:p-hydroxybenzoate 3-monooxygenase
MVAMIQDSATTSVQVGIVGGGPAGLLLSLLLARAGVSSIVLEARSREYCEGRIRAGVLEAGTIDVLEGLGLGARMREIGLEHRGVEFRFDGASHRIPFYDLTGKSIMVYGQHEVVKDLIAARIAAGDPLEFEVSELAVNDVTAARPTIAYRNRAGQERTVRCDFIAGCDGFHGVSRQSIPADVLRVYDRVYPYSWLGILSESPPVHHELIYVNHDSGFALFSQRSPTVQRMYLQCENDEDITQWSDDRIWRELQLRLDGDDAPELIAGSILQRGVTPMRSFVAEPMRYGNLFLAGDAAHIVPPTGAKGMNLAVADVTVLAEGMNLFYNHGDARELDAYSQTVLRRIWKAERFSWWMTSILHRNEHDDAFGRRMQHAELDYVFSSEAAARSLAENYVGLPLRV